MKISKNCTLLLRIIPSIDELTRLSSVNELAKKNESKKNVKSVDRKRGRAFLGKRNLRGVESTLSHTTKLFHTCIIAPVYNPVRPSLFSSPLSFKPFEGEQSKETGVFFLRTRHIFISFTPPLSPFVFLHALSGLRHENGRHGATKNGLELSKKCRYGPSCTGALNTCSHSLPAESISDLENASYPPVNKRESPRNR